MAPRACAASANSISGDGRTVAFAGNDPRLLGRRRRQPPTARLRAPPERVRGGAEHHAVPRPADGHRAVHRQSPRWTTRRSTRARRAGTAASSASSRRRTTSCPARTTSTLNAFVRDTVTGTTEQLNAGHPGLVRRPRGAERRRPLSAVRPRWRRLRAGPRHRHRDVVSRADGPSGAAASVTAQELALSGDGSRAAFVTTAALDAADANGVADVYVRDLATDDTILVSRADDEQAGRRRVEPAVAELGRHGRRLRERRDEPHRRGRRRERRQGRVRPRPGRRDDRRREPRRRRRRRTGRRRHRRCRRSTGTATPSPSPRSRRTSAARAARPTWRSANWRRRTRRRSGPAVAERAAGDLRRRPPRRAGQQREPRRGRRHDVE